MTNYTLNGDAHGLCCKGAGHGSDKQLNAYDWLADVPGNEEICDLVEVQFKNTRKGYYRNSNHLELTKGDVVAVEASPGHDIGTVSMTGSLVLYQMKKTRMKAGEEIKRIYRKARPVDMEKYKAAKAREQSTMIESRKLAKDLGLDMKIGDVEYQGDGNKAIFYYIAEGRVDFRQLIRVLADTFHVRIEMKQIGARQEAGLIGGIGPCGRELCCATWMKNFNSVTTASARCQDLSLNPQKLTGQCAKLKCCLNYEINTYVEAAKKLPSREITLHTLNSEYFFFKADILTGMITYSTDKNAAVNCVTIPSKRAFQILALNRKNEKPETLEESNASTLADQPIDLLEQESLTRFDKVKGRKKKGKRNAVGQGQRNRDKGDKKPKTEEKNGRKPQNNNRNNTSKQGKKRTDNASEAMDNTKTVSANTGQAHNETQGKSRHFRRGNRTDHRNTTKSSKPSAPAQATTPSPQPQNK